MNRHKRIEVQPNIELATSLIKLLVEYATTSKQLKGDAEFEKPTAPNPSGRRRV